MRGVHLIAVRDRETSKSPKNGTNLGVIPRTPADFELITKLAWAGYPDDRILASLSQQRSEVIPLGNGHLVCVRCHQIINIETCPECGLPEVTYEP